MQPDIAGQFSTLKPPKAGKKEKPFGQENESFNKPLKPERQLTTSKSCSHIHGQSSSGKKREIPVCNNFLDGKPSSRDKLNFVNEEDLSQYDDSPISRSFNGTMSGDVVQALKQEKVRRKKLSRLYEEQTTVNELLRDENESLNS